ncbi:MAG: 3'-5' exonuclease [Oscillospiraceae bacterium]
MSKNFRSRDTVLDAANFVFRNVLSREMGELDYGEDESLHVGASYPENPDCCTEFHFVEMSAQESDTEKLRAARAEASFAADYIQRLIAGGFTVQDDKTHEPRAVREEDIVILMRSPRTRLADYRRALESRGLHCAAESDGGFYETMEVAVTFALLEILDNPRQDVPLISVFALAAFRLYAGPARRAARENAGRRFLRCTRRGRGRGLRTVPRAAARAARERADAHAHRAGRGAL